jgi:hypothetical protein
MRLAALNGVASSVALAEHYTSDLPDERRRRLDVTLATTRPSLTMRDAYLEPVTEVHGYYDCMRRGARERADRLRGRYASRAGCGAGGFQPEQRVKLCA